MSNANKPNVKYSKSSKTKPPVERRYTQRRVLDAETEFVIRQTCEKLQVVFLVVKNLQIEVQTLTKAIAQSNQLWLTLCEDSETRRHIQATMKKFNMERGQ